MPTPQWAMTSLALRGYGDDDRLASVGIGRYLVGVIPGARLIEYPGASHALPVTHAQEIAREIVAFSAGS